MIAELARAARALLPQGVAVAVVDPRIDPPPLWPSEIPATSGMVVARRREFAAGRGAIRMALAELGADAAPIGMRADRAPDWPEGIVGSLSHIPTACLAAVARATQFQSLGVDLEDAGPLPEDLWETVLRGPERDWIGTQPADARGRLARIMFSAKEAAYKAQYPLSGQLLDFAAMQIDLDLAAGGFRATMCTPAGPFEIGDRIEGQVACGGGWIMTVAVVPLGRSSA